MWKFVECGTLWNITKIPGENGQIGWDMKCNAMGAENHSCLCMPHSFAMIRASNRCFSCECPPLFGRAKYLLQLSECNPVQRPAHCYWFMHHKMKTRGRKPIIRMRLRADSSKR